MTSRTTLRLLLGASMPLLLVACAGNTPSVDTRSQRDCPSGQVLVCKGGSANSSVSDSELNRTDICICRAKDP